MEPGAPSTATNPRVVWIVVAVVLIVVVAVVASIVAFGLALFKMMDRSDAHTCGLAAVRRSPVAARLVGTPIEQQGLTGGSSSSSNGELNERITFTVKGPLGTAFVVAQGHRSPLESHLDVRIGRDQRGQMIYSGPFTCSQLESH